MQEKQYRRNEDLMQDQQDEVRKKEILAEDYGRMHTGGANVVGIIVRTLIWIAIIYVFIKLIQNWH